MSRFGSVSWYRSPVTNDLDPDYDPDYPSEWTFTRSDNFSDGIDSSFYSNDAGSQWVSAVTTTAAGNSTEKVRFEFVGNANDTADALSQLAFDLGAIYDEIEVEYDLFLPANYSHTVPSDTANNNKFCRFWQITYGNLTSGNKLGASTTANSGQSNLSTECQHFGSGVGPGFGDGDIQSNNFFATADLGTWMRIKLHVKAPNPENNYEHTNVNGTFQRGDGFIRVYKNNVLTAHNETIAAVGVGVQGWRYGYLMGSANSGFRENTYFYLDNIEFRAR